MPTALGTVASHRSSTAFAPGTLTNLAYWYDATDATTFTFTTGSQFTQWRDKGPNGFHLTGVDHPNFRRAGDINGKVAILYDHPSADVPLTCANVNILSLLGGGTDCMVFIVCKPNTSGGPGNPQLLYIPDGTGTQRVSCQFSSPSAYLDLGSVGGARVIFDPLMTTNPVLYSYWRNGANMAVAKDGTNLATKADASGIATSATGTLNILKPTYNPGHLGEVIHVARYNATDYTATINYLKAKWGTP